MEALLQEAFVGIEPSDAFKGAAKRSVLPGGRDGQFAFIQRLVSAASTLSLADEPKPYYPQRYQVDPEPIPLRIDVIRRRFAQLVGEFDNRGYLDRVFPAPRVDDSDSLRVDKSEFLEGLLGVPNLWPM